MLNHQQLEELIRVLYNKKSPPAYLSKKLIG